MISFSWLYAILKINLQLQFLTLQKKKEKKKKAESDCCLVMATKALENLRIMKGLDINWNEC